MIVLLYLAAVVAANLAISAIGPIGAIPVAFLFVGFDLFSRDALHERWRGPALWPRMFALIATGGILSALLGGSPSIAVASSVAFVLSGLADAIVYTLLGRRTYLVRSNGSNLAGAAVDSLVFPTLAFGAFLPAIVLGQFTAKVAGGLFWYVVFAAIAYRSESLHEGSPMGLRDFALYVRISSR